MKVAWTRYMVVGGAALQGCLSHVAEPLPPPERTAPACSEVDLTSLTPLTPPQEEQFRDGLRAYSGQVLYCYNRGLEHDPSLEGRLELVLRVDEGVVEDAQVWCADPALGAVAACAAEKAKSWRFHRELSATGVHPYVMRPRDAR